MAAELPPELPPELTEEKVRDISYDYSPNDELEDAMGEYFAHLAEAIAQDYCLSPEQQEALEDRLSWKLILLPPQE